MAYRYRPAHESTIRVLALEPGGRDAPLKGELQEELWGMWPFAHYEALSYCWGGNVKDHLLETPGGFIEITKSLFQALRNIRSETGHKLIWADAICINQDDLKEKEFQVQRMGQIYHHAQTVIVYLGEEDEHGSQGFDLLQAYTAGYALANGFDHPDMRNHAALAGSHTDWEPIGQPELLESEAERVHLTELFHILQSRDKSEEFFEFKKGFTLFYCLGIEKMRRQSNRRSLDNTPPEIDSDEAYQDLKINVLFDMLTVMRGRDARDPRDNIYAFLSLIYPQTVLPWLTNRFPISYKTSVTDVAKHYGYLMLQKLHGQALYAAGLTQQKQPPSEWPSWVPDWSVPNHFGQRFWLSKAAELGRYTASGDQEFSASLDANNGDLMLLGTIVDRIKQVGTFNKWAAYSNSREAIKAFIIDCILVLEDDRREKVYKAAFLEGVLARVVMGNSMDDGTEPPPRVGKAFSLFVFNMLDSLSDCHSGSASAVLELLESEIEDDVLVVIAQMQKILPAWVLCVTEDGRLGLAPKGTNIGDVVAVVMGCCVPVIFRSTSVDMNPTGPFWLVGEA